MSTTTSPTALTTAQRVIVPIAAFAAAGDIDKLTAELDQGLDAGLTISEAKEVLVQVYAYAGFPRSLNALTALMQTVEARRRRGIQDAYGREPSRPVPTGDALLEAGTANQTKLSGSPVRGPLFAFAPLADQYLKTHLFGDIFERDNLDWQTREVATVSMLAAMSGTDAQLLAHVRISMNIGVSPSRLEALAQVLDARVSPDSGTRLRAMLTRQVEDRKAMK